MNYLGENNSPEAILPLERGSDGKLGVKGVFTHNQGQQNVVVEIPVVINNEASDQVEVEQREVISSNGQKQLEVFIHKVVDGGLATGRYKNSMSRGYGVKYKGV